MSGGRATLLLLALAGIARFAAAGDPDVVELNRLEYRLSQLEKRASDMLVTQVTARQQVLDAGPEISRKKCEQLAHVVANPDELKYLRGIVKELEARKSFSKLNDGQKQRLSAVKSRVERLEEDSSMDCKALAPINS